MKRWSQRLEARLVRLVRLEMGKKKCKNKEALMLRMNIFSLSIIIGDLMICHENLKLDFGSSTFFGSFWKSMMREAVSTTSFTDAT